MHRIDQPTAQAGMFTNGNTSTGIKATIVDADWLNGVQEALAQFITSRGIALTKGDHTTLTQAILSASENNSSASFTVDNNITVATAVTGLIFDKTKFKSARILCDVYRKTATLEYSSLVTLELIYYPVDNKWYLTQNESSPKELSGVDFSIDQTTGQISYKSSNMAGGTYAGTLRYKVSRINLN